MAESPPSSEGDAPPRDRGEELTEEFRYLGNNLKSILRSAWESPERRKLQQEIETGMSELGNTVNQAVNEFNNSPSGQRLKEDARDFQDRLRAGEVDKRIREDLLSVLQRFNAELEKVARPSEPEEESQDKTEG
jgi:hypothetical protein